jgi:GNAT superfamily N-acetyltransferase
MVTAPDGAHLNVYELGVADVERVITIDRTHSGRSRRRFFEKRFAAAAARPDDYVHIGAMRGGAMRGFAIARILRGEFGYEQAVAVLDAIGVEATSQERGIGQALMEALSDIMRQNGVGLLQTQADWTNHDLLRFFSAAGFKLAPRLVLQRPAGELPVDTSEDV